MILQSKLFHYSQKKNYPCWSLSCCCCRITAILPNAYLHHQHDQLEPMANAESCQKPSLYTLYISAAAHCEDNIDQLCLIHSASLFRQACSTEPEIQWLDNFETCVMEVFAPLSTRPLLLSSCPTIEFPTIFHCQKSNWVTRQWIWSQRIHSLCLAWILQHVHSTAAEVQQASCKNFRSSENRQSIDMTLSISIITEAFVIQKGGVSH